MMMMLQTSGSREWGYLGGAILPLHQGVTFVPADL